jgi:hypothetical protein
MGLRGPGLFYIDRLSRSVYTEEVISMTMSRIDRGQILSLPAVWPVCTSNSHSGIRHERALLGAGINGGFDNNQRQYGSAECFVCLHCLNRALN